VYRYSYIEQAIILREQGYSLAMIQEKVPVAKSTLSRWLKHIPFTANAEVEKRIGYALSRAIESKQKQKERSYTQAAALAASDFSRCDTSVLFMGLALYMGEGEKNNNVGVANSDPELIQLFIVWLYEIYGVTAGHLTIAIHIYVDVDERVAKDYWSACTGIPLTQFGKTQIDTRVKTAAMKRGRLPHGTAHVRIKSNGKKDYGVLLSRRIEESIKLLSRAVVGDSHLRPLRTLD